MPTDNKMNQGAKAQGQSWRDHYGTPQPIKDAVAKFYDLANRYNCDPCPWNHDTNAFTFPWADDIGFYVNPPFSVFFEWAQHFTSMPNEQIWMCHHKHSTKWFEKLMERAEMVLMFRNRIVFIDPRTGKPATDENGRPQTAIGLSQSLVYIPSQKDSRLDIRVRKDQFEQCFSEFGYILEVRV